MSTTDDLFGGGFAEVRDGEQVPTIIRSDSLTAAAAPMEDPMTEQTPEAPGLTDGPTHAGLAVQALDTGRVLMLQRALDPEDPASGTFEFPGGSIEDGETPLEGARREWTEETGMIAPTLDPVGGWTSPDGVYEAFVVQIPAESDLLLNPDDHGHVDGNPDDPERETPEVTLWLSQEDIAAMGEAIRQEVREGTDWTQFAPTVVAQAVVAAGDAPEVPEMQVVELRVGSRHPEFLSAFVGLCQSIQYLSSVGASRTLTFDVDGDGAADLMFDFGDTQVPDSPPITEDDLDGDQVHIPGIAGSAAFSVRPLTAAGDFDWAVAIVNARLSGASYAELADQFGYTSAGAARKAVMRALEAAERPTEPVVAPEAPGPLEAAVLDAAGTYADAVPEDLPVPDGAPALAQDIPEDGRPFYGIVAPEGVPSDDSREFGTDSMLARDLPLPLMFQDAQEEGHGGAVRVGRIDNVWRDTTTYPIPMIRYSGVWDSSDIAAEAERQVENGVAKGVSVDGVDVTTRLVDAQGNTLDPMSDDFPEDGVVIEHADQVKMAGLTICSVPAFEQTYIANGLFADRTDPEPGQTPRKPLPSGDAEGPGTETPDVPVEPVVASAAWTIGLVASANGEGDWVVPAAHFTNPELTEATALTVTPDGRVYGHLATWGQCHIGQAAGRRGEQVRAAGKCMEVPTSASGYAFFATGVVHTDDGQQVNVGQLTMDTGHANLQLGAKQTVDHYDHTGAPVADIVVGHDAIGIWFSGHVRPTATPAQVYSMTASGSVSGDWREVVRRSNQLELVAALVVNVPGFPIGRPAVTASAGGPVALVASGAVTRPEAPQNGAQGLSDRPKALVASITREVMASIDRQQRAAGAVTRVRTHRAQRALARFNQRS